MTAVFRPSNSWIYSTLTNFVLASTAFSGNRPTPPYLFLLPAFGLLTRPRQDHYAKAERQLLGQFSRKGREIREIHPLLHMRPSKYGRQNLTITVGGRPHVLLSRLTTSGRRDSNDTDSPNCMSSVPIHRTVW